jgi:hypothetical protein
MSQASSLAQEIVSIHNWSPLPDLSKRMHILSGSTAQLHYPNVGRPHEQHRLWCLSPLVPAVTFVCNILRTPHQRNNLLWPGNPTTLRAGVTLAGQPWKATLLVLPRQDWPCCQHRCSNRSAWWSIIVPDAWTAATCSGGVTGPCQARASLVWAAGSVACICECFHWPRHKSSRCQVTLARHAADRSGFAWLCRGIPFVGALCCAQVGMVSSTEVGVTHQFIGGSAASGEQWGGDDLCFIVHCALLLRGVVVTGACHATLSPAILYIPFLFLC